MIFTGGLPETVCGLGSTLEVTAHLREFLPGLLKRLSVSTLLDAPCGDFNWMASTDLSGIDYIGCDVDPEHLVIAKIRTSSARSVTFIEMDIVDRPLPSADAMICREFLQHLPHARVLDALRNLVASGIPWLLATSHGTLENEDIVLDGMFRPLNLVVEPLSLSKPEFAIADPPGSDRIIGAWSREAIRSACV